MKKLTVLGVAGALLAATFILQADCDCKCKTTSHTFFSARPHFQTATPERVVLFRDRMNAAEDGHRGAFQVAIYGGQSEKNDRLARFFTPFCKTCLTVSNNLVNHTADLIAQEFGIYTSGTTSNPLTAAPYNSTFCLCPRQAFVGAGLAYRQGFWHCDEKDMSFWFELAMPIEHIRNQIKLCEKFDNNVSPSMADVTLPANMIDAFNQPAWIYGKIKNCYTMEKTGVADFEIKLGYEWLKNECCFFESYVGVIAPTGNRPTARYVFEPMVGFNKHTGIELGGSGTYEIWRTCNDIVLTYALDMNTMYLFRNCERRSFDIKDRPWSRYMQVYENKEQATEAAALLQTAPLAALTIGTPGINVFTRNLNIEPRMQLVINNGLYANYCNWQVEIGYNYFMREAECVSLKGCWDETVAFKDIRVGTGFTNPLQSINLNIVSSVPAQPLAVLTGYDNNVIPLELLDLESAAHPAVSINTIYASIGYNWDHCKYPSFAGIGGEYESSDENTGMNRWTIWGKGGISF